MVFRPVPAACKGPHSLTFQTATTTTKNIQRIRIGMVTELVGEQVRQFITVFSL